VKKLDLPEKAEAWYDQSPDLPQTPWGEHTRQPAFLAEPTKKGRKSRHYFGGADEKGDAPKCSFCGWRMQVTYRLDLTDPVIRDLLKVRGSWEKIMLPFCAECNNVVYLNVFSFKKNGGIIHEKVYIKDTLPFKKRKNVVYMGFSLFPIHLHVLSDEKLFITESSYNEYCPTYSRNQIGGFPLYIDKAEYIKNPNNGNRLHFIASLAELNPIAKACGLGGTMALADGGLFFFADWEEGLLVSVFQRS
jgi:hypothetical protein